MTKTLGLTRLLAILLFLTLISGCAPEEVKYNAQGNEHFENAAYPAALDDYRQAQVAAPDRPEPYYNAANAYNRQGEVAGAQAQTQQALKTAEDELAAQAWYNLGNAYFDAQQWQAAVEAYKEALRITPDDQDAKHNLELALQKLQDQQQQAQNQQQQQEQDQQQNQGDSEEQQSQQENQEQESEETQEQDQQQQSSESQEEEAQQQEGGQQETQMTPEQAQQLLQAILGDSETLQERLQRMYQAPGGAPEEDW